MNTYVPCRLYSRKEPMLSYTVESGNPEIIDDTTRLVLHRPREFKQVAPRLEVLELYEPFIPPQLYPIQVIFHGDAFCPGFCELLKQRPDLDWFVYHVPDPQTKVIDVLHMLPVMYKTGVQICSNNPFTNLEVLAIKLMQQAVDTEEEQENV